MTTRSHVSITKKLAATLLALRDANGNRLVPYEDSKLMTADQIISLFQFDHYPIRVVDGGPDEPWNLTPRLIKQHRQKTAGVDAGQIAKQRRLTKQQEELRRVLTKPCGHKRRTSSRWPKRPFNNRRSK